MKKYFYIILIFFGMLSAGELEKPKFTFVNVSLNYFDWGSRIEAEEARKDFSYLELEGGAFWEWGDLYAFVDIENPLSHWNDATPNDMRISLKPIINITITHDLSFYVQNYHLESKSFYVNNLVTGIAYGYKKNNFFIRPFLGSHYQDSTYYSGQNGYMGGWFWRYDFSVSDKHMYAFQWHEIEFKRAHQHYMLDDNTKIGDGASWGVNGDVALFINLIDSMDVGFQYRYAYQKLGLSLYQNAFIYSLKYNF